MIVRETHRLRLRWATASDAEFILELVNDPDWLRFIGDRGVQDLDAARVFIEERLVASYHEHGYGLYLTERREDGVPIGICGLVRREGLDGPDVGFAFLRAYRSLGFAYEAAAATLEFAGDDLGLERIFAVTEPDNHSSIRLLTRLGLRSTGMVRLPGIAHE